MFFIPVIPYESGHLLICSVCSQGTELDKTKQAKAKELVELARSLREQQISQDEFETHASTIRLLE